jgi:hypothetical protein
MNWLERICGISPDGGGGASELVLMLALAMVVTAIAFVATKRFHPGRRVI